VRTKVVVTGARGLVGRVITSALEGEYDVVGLDRRRSLSRPRRVDMARSASARRALRGADVVVDLASVPRVEQPWESVRDNNVPAAWNAMEAARLGGARRVVYASSNHVTGLYEDDEPYERILRGNCSGLDPGRVPRLTAASPVRPDGPYAVGKAFAEAAARYYSEVHGLSVLCLRIGTLNRADRPQTARHLATWISHADLAHLVRCCIEAPPEVRFGVFYGVSRNTWRIWDLDDAHRAVGYAPSDDADEWRDEVLGTATAAGARGREHP
jgi:uronate dehydrogenase